MPQDAVEGDDVDLSDFRSQILRRTSTGAPGAGGGGGVAPGVAAAALSRVSARIAILMNLQRTTSRTKLLASREASLESSPSGRRLVQSLALGA